ncbi:MAG: hypothetical protein CL927_10945 [Deltaproteobacteria bacterium]|nr:hypothetical protein [Deltaproteobacteria bacterium]HCH66343.1 hypothetical protein [Deltaproteobacteria bacterium]
MPRRTAPTKDAESTLDGLFSGLRSRARSSDTSTHQPTSRSQPDRAGARAASTEFDSIIPTRRGSGATDDRPEGRDARFGSRPRTLHGPLR